MNDSFQQPAATPAYLRIRRRFDAIAAGDDALDVGHLVLAVLLEESLGGKCLRSLGVDVSRIRSGCFGTIVAGACEVLQQEDMIEAENCSVADPSSNTASSGKDDPLWLRQLHERALLIARRTRDTDELASHHLVQAMVEVNGPAKQQLAGLGVTLDNVLSQLSPKGDTPVVPLPVDFELSTGGPVGESTVADVCSATGMSGTAAGRSHKVRTLIDANLNRAREGLRVLEDYARFVVHDHAATQALKQLRHRMVESELELQRRIGALLPHRDVGHDVGTSITTETEQRRAACTDIVAANARRVQEALRSLEEFGKTLSGTFAGQMKQLRYGMYALEQSLLQHTAHPNAAMPEDLRTERTNRLAEARLYVLLTESLCQLPWKDAVAAALDGGSDVIQLREKMLCDDEIIERGRWIAAACEQAGALFILNDRCDLAVAARAHGVHIGQEDADVPFARSQLDSQQLLGVSTNDRDQLTAACREDIDYLGVGPVFASGTKPFDHFPGINYVTEAAALATCPWFAIGGIDSENVGQVCAAGADRIAVAGAVAGAADPKAAALKLRSALLNAAVEGPQTLRIQRG